PLTMSDTRMAFPVTEDEVIMTIFRRMFLAASVAGILSGLFIGIVHQITTAELIRSAEVFERAAPEHGPEEAGHENHAEGWEPSDGIERIFYTMLADALAGIGFSLLLIA